MKIIQINTVYASGSTGKITASLYKIISNSGNEALVGYGRGPLPASYGVDGMRIGNRPDFYTHVLYNFFTGKNGYASTSVTRKFLSWLDRESPDIIHLHNIHGFYLNIHLLFDYIKAKKIPVVWTLHDCWSFTGNCAFFDYVKCTKWIDGCHNCPIHRSDYPYSLFKDNSINNYASKLKDFTNVEDLTIVTPSYWLKNLVEQSFLKNYPVEVIPNGIDHTVFHPYDDNEASENKILLGVANIWDARKGLSYMKRLADDFNEANGYQVVVVGLSSKQKKELDLHPHHNMVGICRTASQEELAKWYSRAHLYINPTLQDNFPTTNIEALCCGTPVVTFDTGGSKESLTLDCGIVVPKGDYSALKNAIISVETAKLTSSACISRGKLYRQETAFDNYIKLYNSIYEK